MPQGYLTDAPCVRVWYASGNVTYIWDNVKNRYYFISGPVWLPVNQRQTGDFEAADGSINQELLGFRLHATIAFDICADDQRPVSIEMPPQTGITYQNLLSILNAIKAGTEVEFFPHFLMMDDDATSAGDTFLAGIDSLDVNRADGQSISHVQITWKGLKCVTAMPDDF